MIGVGSWEAAGAEAAGGGSSSSKRKSGGFQSMGLDKPLLDAILRNGFAVPTPIQRKAIPTMLQGNDVVAMARTGSGKTAAFLVPMLQRLQTHSKIVGIRGLVLAPTRELSLQILRDAFALNKLLDLRFAALVGGHALDAQFELLASNPDLVIATPGRLLHIMEETSLQLSAVRMLVLDEADRLFELGLQPQIVSIMQKIPETAQRALFSATMPSVLAEFANAGLHNPVVIRLDAEVKLSEKLKQSAFLVRSEDKTAALVCVLKRIIRVGEGGNEAVDGKQHGDGDDDDDGRDKTRRRSKAHTTAAAAASSSTSRRGSGGGGSSDGANNSGGNGCGAQALVFVESRFHVDYLQSVLTHYHIRVSGVHGQMDQEARRLAVHDFTRRRTSVLIVTDVAARGLDIPLLDHVVNYSFPFNVKLFVHRVGRVARAGRAGAAYSLMTYEDFPYYVELMQFLEAPLQCRAPSSEDGDGDEHALFLPDDRCYGRLPEDELQLELDFLKRLHDNDVELRNLARVVEHAHRKYNRTRRKPTHEAIQIARQPQYAFDATPLHPMLLERLGTRQVAADAARRALRHFKAKESLLELTTGERVFALRPPETVQSLARQEQQQQQQQQRQAATTRTRNAAAAATAVAAAAPVSLAESLLRRAQERKKRARAAAAGADDEQDDSGYSNTMKRARPTHNDSDDDGGGDLARQLGDRRHGGSSSSSAAPAAPEGVLASLESGKYRDGDFFLDTAPPQHVAEGAHYSLKEATLDMAAESAAEAAQQRQVYAWSNKKNRYVKMNVTDAKAMLKGIKNEAGKAINHKAKLQDYLKWTRKSNLRIQDVGEEEDLGPLQRARAAAAAAKPAVSTMMMTAAADDGEAQDEYHTAAGIGYQHNNNNGSNNNKDDDVVDISNPNQGKKLRIGRKQRRLPKDGHVRSFDELAAMKRKATREKERLAKKAHGKAKRKNTR